MANEPVPTSIENVLAKYVGWTIGVGEQSDSGSTDEDPNAANYVGTTDPTVADGLTLDAVENGRAGRWFTPSERGEKWTGNQGWKPDTKSGALVFWRRMGSDAFANWEWLTVTITPSSSSGDQVNESAPEVTDGTEDTATDPVNAIGEAWQPVALAIPKMVGKGTPFDPGTLQVLRDTLKAIGEWTDSVWSYLDNDISKIDTKAANFEGSAAEGFRDLVADAQRGMAGILHASTTNWNTALQDAVDKSWTFVKALQSSVETWRDPKDGSPADTWLHPLRLIIHMFNQSLVTELENLDYNQNHSGGLWETGRIAGDQSVIYDTYTSPDGNTYSSIDGYKTMIIQFPTWSGVEGQFDVLRPPSWDLINTKTQAAWVAHVRNAFKPAVDAVQDMVDAMTTAGVNSTLKEMESSEYTGSSGSGNDSLNDLYNQMNNYADNFNAIGNQFNNIGDAFNNVGGAFNNIGDEFNNIGNTFNEFGNEVGNNFNEFGNEFSNAFAGVGNTFNEFGNEFGNAFDGVGNTFNEFGNEFNEIGNTFNELGNSYDNAFGEVGNSLNSISGGLGDGLNDLAGSLFLSSTNPNSLNEVTSESGIGGLGETTGDPQTLGDLTTEQLQELADSGLLDDTELTDEQKEILSAAGLDAGDATTLGDLDDEQLQTLLESGGLDSTAITPAQTSQLVSSGLLDVGEGADDLGDLSEQQLQTLADEGLLDSVPLTDEDLETLQREGLLGSDTSGLDDLGDLNADQLQALSDAGLLDDVSTTQDQISALADAGQLGATDGSIQNLGDLSAAQLAELDSAGLLDDTPITDEQIAQLQQDGLLGADTTGIDSLGDLSEAQLEDLRENGLLDDVQLTTEQLSDLDETGLLGTPDNLSTSLGDLSTEQLDALDDSGLLDDNPITAEQIEELQDENLLGADTSGIDSLGDLNAEQLAALDEAGLLDDIPVTAEQSASLGTDGLDTLGDLGATTATSAFPTGIDTVDINPQTSTPTGSVGDITQARTGTVPGGSGTTGFSTGGGLAMAEDFDTGDLSTGQDETIAAGTGAIGGPDDELTGSSTSDLSSSSSPMMPYMPGMGGMGQGAQQADGKDRERQTWLVEEDDIWGTDPQVGAAVIGRGDGAAPQEEQEYGQEVTPEQPGGPRRTRQPRRSH